MFSSCDVLIRFISMAIYGPIESHCTELSLSGYTPLQDLFCASALQLVVKALLGHKGDTRQGNHVSGAEHIIGGSSHHYISIMRLINRHCKVIIMLFGLLYSVSTVITVITRDFWVSGFYSQITAK